MSKIKADKPTLNEAPANLALLLKPGAASPRLINVIDHYLAYYATSGTHTARAKQLDLEHFLAFLARIKRLDSPDTLKVSDWDFSATQRFVDDGLSRGDAPSTVARRLATVKHMGRTLAEQIAGFINPARNVRAPRLSAERPKGLDSKESDTILERGNQRNKDRPSFNRKRDFVLVQVLLETGLRADEVRLLKGNQLSTDLNWFCKVRTKGRHYRNVYVPESLRSVLQDYLIQRNAQLERFYGEKVSIKRSEAHPLFISTYRVKCGAPQSFFLSEKTVWRAVHVLGHGSKLHPHKLRHTFALGLLESSHDIRLVAQALGHSDVRTTMRYTERSDEQVAQAIERRSKAHAAKTEKT